MTIDAVRAGYRLREVELDLEHRATGRSLGGFLHRGRQLLRHRARLPLAAVSLPAVILAIDQGTTGTTCLVFDREGRIAGRALLASSSSTSRARAGSSTTPTRSGR